MGLFGFPDPWSTWHRIPDPDPQHLIFCVTLSSKTTGRSRTESGRAAGDKESAKKSDDRDRKTSISRGGEKKQPVKQQGRGKPRDESSGSSSSEDESAKKK
jgi:hypothetical protein